LLQAGHQWCFVQFAVVESAICCIYATMQHLQQAAMLRSRVFRAVLRGEQIQLHLIAAAAS
jgi:hypothetical protein